MTAENEFDRPARFAGYVLPWLLAGGLLAVYALTLDHWVSPDSLRHITNLRGTAWTSELTGPVSYLASYPIRWLPAAWIALVANLFSALCAALTLALLARSVVLLPHARPGRKRRENEPEHGSLIRRNAWLPPVLATLVCGLQLTFWEQATTATGEMLDVLLFAYLIRCLLEYRINQRESWLWRFAFVNGLAMADDWAMVAFSPAFLLALLWFLGLPRFFNPRFMTDVLKRRVNPFNARLFVRLLLCWLAGISLFLLLPLLASRSRNGEVNFWTGLGFAVRIDKALLLVFPLRLVLLLSVTSLVPVLFMAIRWRRLIRDSNPWAKFFTRFMSHAIHGFFLAACLLTMLDSVCSPRHLQPAFACLPLYYLTALGVGYYSGHFLLAFNIRSSKRHRRPRQSEIYFNVASIGAMCLLALLAPALLEYKNLPLILRQRNSALGGYFDTMLKTLPAKGAVIMSEDSARLHWLESALVRHGNASDYALVDTSLLTRFPAYLQFLDRRYPDFHLMTAVGYQAAEVTNPPVLVQWMQGVSRAHGVYLMHPFVGYLAERFYAQPRELLYELQPYPTNAIIAPPLPDALIAENRSFWKRMADEQFPGLLRRLQPPRSGDNPIGHLFRLAHVQAEPDRDAMLAASYYSLMLDGWGVEAQWLGDLAGAGICFATAEQLNPDNSAAQINLACNRDLQARKPLAMESNKRLEDFLGKHRNWDQSLRQDGPIDEPNSCYRLGLLFSGSSLQRQALQQFRRAQALVPDATNAPLRLGELYAQLGDYPNALAEANLVLRFAPENSRALVVKGLSLVELGKYYEAISTLNDALNLQANDMSARMVRGLAYLKLQKFLAAREDYTQVALANPSAYPVYYGLAEIAYHLKENATAIHNCELYLSNAPEGAPEAQQIKDWLKELKKPANR